MYRLPPCAAEPDTQDVGIIPKKAFRCVVDTAPTSFVYDINALRRLQYLGAPGVDIGQMAYEAVTPRFRGVYYTISTNTSGGSIPVEWVIT